jgi:hypothetical protein
VVNRGAARWFVRLSLLVGLGCSACGKRDGSAPFAAERIPAGAGWRCWTGHCARTCQGMPGALMADGTAPEPVCERPKTAFCTTFALHKAPMWECFPSRTACEANQKHYQSEAAHGRDYASVSPCTELP